MGGGISNGGAQESGSPAAHDIRIAAEDLAETTDDDVCIGQDLNVYEVPDSLIDHQEEVVLVGELA